MNIVDKMARLAMVAHNGVNRRGPGNIPYIVHPHSVVSLLKSWGYDECQDVVTLAVAWGHDILEDTNTSEATILETINHDTLGQKILTGIKMLTFKPNIPLSHQDYDKMKAEYIENVARYAPPEIIVVKIADRFCNTLDFAAVDYAREYFELGTHLYSRIKDCKNPDRIEEMKQMIQSAVFCE